MKEGEKDMDDNNKRIALNVLEAVGGKDNILAVTHCMTRLRFNLSDMNFPDQESIKKLDGVLGVVVSGGQFQVVIGQNVPKVYAAVCEILGIERTEETAVSDGEKKTTGKEKLTLKKIGSNIMNYMAGCMTPLIPAIVTAAMFKTILTVLGPDMAGIIQPENDIAVLLDFLYDAFFYFMPIFIGFTAASKLGMNPIMGLYAGAILLAPDFVALVSTEGASFTVFGIPCVLNDYAQSVVPIVLTVWVMSYISRFFNKIVPDTLSTIFAPFLTIAVTTPIELCLLAPAGSVLGNYVGNGLLAFGTIGGFVATGLVAGLWEFLVITGMHVVLGMFGITAIITNGMDSAIMPSASCATWAAFGMALGVFLRIKSKKEKSLSLSYFISGILGGVTEPALYGIGFKYKRPFMCMAVGGFLGGAYAGLTHVGVYAAGITNFLSILNYVAGGTANMVNGVISLLISLFGTAALTYFFGFKKGELA